MAIAMAYRSVMHSAFLIRMVQIALPVPLAIGLTSSQGQATRRTKCSPLLARMPQHPGFPTHGQAATLVRSRQRTRYLRVLAISRTCTEPVRRRQWSLFRRIRLTSSASVSLAYIAAMQENRVPVTYAYISDAHDAHPSGPAYGPGQAGYVAALAAYDDAFNKFFTRLAKDGIDQSNTLFVFTADEGDHFVGGPPSPANCDGVTTPCTYSQIGELAASMPNLLSSQQGITAPFDIHSDSAPTVYVTGNPARTDTLARSFEQATGKLTVPNPITGHTDNLTKFLADPVEMKLLHMVTADPFRTPTYTLFADPNYFVCNAFSSGCPTSPPFVTQNPAFAWNHGDVQPEIVTTWLGMVGPGVDQKGIDSTTWSDHTDIRPTILTLAGL